jgi:hypothetical protein
MTQTIKFKPLSLVWALALVTMFTTLQSSSCSKDDVPLSNVGNISGTWKVSLYWDAKDETSKFTGYVFTFSNGGQITATNGTTTVTGTWSESSSKLTIDFGSHPVFSKLSDDWLKEEKNSSSIKLKDDNPAKDEKLQFVLN